MHDLSLSLQIVQPLLHPGRDAAAFKDLAPKHGAVCTGQSVQSAFDLQGPVELRRDWSCYTAALRKRGSLLIWLDKEMTWLAPHDGSPSRPAVFSDAAMQFCLSIKILFKLPLRQTTGMVASLLKLAELDWAVPDYTTLCRRQKTLVVQIPYRRAMGR